MIGEQNEEKTRAQSYHFNNRSSDDWKMVPKKHIILGIIPNVYGVERKRQKVALWIRAQDYSVHVVYFYPNSHYTQNRIRMITVTSRRTQSIVIMCQMTWHARDNNKNSHSHMSDVHRRSLFIWWETVIDLRGINDNVNDNTRKKNCNS